MTDREFQERVVRRLVIGARRMLYSGIWLSVEEVESLLGELDELRKRMADFDNAMADLNAARLDVFGGIVQYQAGGSAPVDITVVWV